MHHLRLQCDDPSSPDVRTLIEQLDSYLSRLYPRESNHLLSVDSLREPNVTFLTARLNGKVVGCGAFVNRAGEYAEIKRMFVLPECRGMGLGRRILEELGAARTGGGSHAGPARNRHLPTRGPLALRTGELRAPRAVRQLSR